jgi:hypothetical protein
MEINNFTKYIKVHNKDTQVEFTEFIVEILLKDKESFDYYKQVLESLKNDENCNGASACQTLFQCGMMYGIHGLMNKLRTGEIKFDQIKINKEENINGRN